MPSESWNWPWKWESFAGLIILTDGRARGEVNEGFSPAAVFTKTEDRSNVGPCGDEVGGRAIDEWVGSCGGRAELPGYADGIAALSDGSVCCGRGRVSGDRAESREAQPVGAVGAAGASGGAVPGSADA